MADAQSPEDAQRAERKQFRRLMRKVKAKDQEACRQLVVLFQSEIYRQVRLPLIGLGLQTIIDPMDICQAVFTSFFERVVGGPYELKDPQQVRHLLLTMARNKVTDESRRYMAARRNQQKQIADAEDCLRALPADISTPSSIVGKRELIAEVLKYLTEEERWVVERRSQGVDWTTLATELNTSPDALRKKIDRAIERVNQQMQHSLE